MDGNKRIIRSLDLKEISAVVKPAQEPALAAIIKSAIAGPVERLETAGKSIPDAYRQAFDALVASLGAKEIGGVFGASVDAFASALASDKCDFDIAFDVFARASANDAAQSGDVAKQAADAVIVACNNLEAIAKARRADTESKAMSDTKIAELEGKVAELTARIKAADEALAVEKARADEAVAKASAIEKSASDEVLVVKGVELRKSKTDPASFEIMKALHEETEVAKAKDDVAVILKNIPGEIDAKVSVIRAIKGIKDEAARTAALDLLKKGSEAFGDLLASKGTGKPGKEQASSAQAEFDEACGKFMADQKIGTVAKATLEFVRTPEGRRLQKAVNDEAHKAAQAA